MEIGAGTSNHTKVVLDTKAKLTAFDISSSSLEVLRLRHSNLSRIINGSMEEMPFLNEEFDAVVSFGSLSYGNPKLVFAEIYRVLRPSGKLIMIDTLANNPLFALNRLRHVLLG